jgi:hypothetical protein
MPRPESNGPVTLRTALCSVFVSSRLALPHNDCPPVELPQVLLMLLITRGVALQLGQPPFATVRRCRAVFAAAMPMPEAAMDENGRFVSREDDVGLSRQILHMEPKPKAHPMEQRADDLLGIGVLPSNPGHVWLPKPATI